MNMKKILMVLITLALVCTMAGAVSADVTGYENNVKTQDVTVKVSTSTSALFTIVIPDTVDLIVLSDGEISGALKIQLTDLKFNRTKFVKPEGSADYTTYQNLKISVTSDDWALKSDLFDKQFGYTGTLQDNLVGFSAGEDSSTTFKDGQHLLLDGNNYMKSGYETPLPYTVNIHLAVDEPESLPLTGDFTDTLTIEVGFEDVGTTQA